MHIAHSRILEYLIGVAMIPLKQLLSKTTIKNVCYFGKFQKLGRSTETLLFEKLSHEIIDGGC